MTCANVKDGSIKKRKETNAERRRRRGIAKRIPHDNACIVAWDPLTSGYSCECGASERRKQAMTSEDIEWK